MPDIDHLAVNTIRMLSAEAVQKANSGHPGLPMGAAPMAYTLFSRKLRHNPADPAWHDRDRFVLSAGHGSMLLYSLLHLFGYGVSIEDLQSFRQWGSKTPGHPEYRHTPGVETTTGPLGQGLANAVGFALAEARLAAEFNRDGFPIVDHYTYALAGDGCMMEGVSSEACSLAGTWKLGKLIVFYDSNRISIEGSTDLAFTEDVAARYSAYGWQVLDVADGNDIEAIDCAIEQAKADAQRPSLIVVHTQIGYGCPAKQGKASAHGEPLGAENLEAARKCLGWEYPPFTVPEPVAARCADTGARGAALQLHWEAMMRRYGEAYPELSERYTAFFSGKIPEGMKDDPQMWAFDKPDATRNTSGATINRLAEYLPNLFGGSADLSPSTKTLMAKRGHFSAEERTGDNLHFGVREFAMACIANGVALHGGLIPYVATFFVFCDYMKAAMRLSALMRLPVVYVLTHDSIGVGEDGPTHQPIEQLASLRSIPNFTVLRPADGRETAAAWLAALEADGPSALVLTRQNLPQYQGSGPQAARGGYVLRESSKEVPDILLLASGSEVELVFKAAQALEEKGVCARVVSMLSWELFERQDAAYREQVLPTAVRKRLAVEAGASLGWHKYVGLDGDVLSIDHFGASAPADRLMQEFGFTVDNVIRRALALLEA